MKKLLVIGIIAMMITGLSVAANAFAGTVLNIQPVYTGGATAAVQVGWFTDYNGSPSANAVDNSDASTDLAVPDGVMQMYINPLSGLTGTTIGDFRAPDVSAYPSQTVTKLWRLNVNMPANADHVAANYGIKLWFNPGFGPGATDFFVFEGAPTLTAMKAAATAGSGFLAKLTATSQSWESNATQWLLPAPSSSTVEDPDTGEIATVWGAAPVQQFSIYAQGAPAAQTPEPGSMLAMFSGLVGLVGFGIRRRK